MGQKLSQQFTFEANAKDVYEFFMGPEKDRPRSFERTDNHFSFVCSFLISSNSKALYSIVLRIYVCSGESISFIKDRNWLVWDREAAEITLSQSQAGKCTGKLYVEELPDRWSGRSDGWIVPMSVASGFTTSLWRELVQEAIDHFANRRTSNIMNQSSTGQHLVRVMETMRDLSKDSPHTFVNDVDISRETSISLQDVRDYLDVLEQRGLTKAANTFGGHCAMLTAQGRIILRDPQFSSSSSAPIINVHANNGVFVNVGSTLTSVNQTINVSTNLKDNEKESLAHLVAELAEALKSVPEAQADDAEAVAETAKDLVAKVDKQRPNPSLVTISAEGLKAAAKNVAEVAPTVLAVALKIVTFVQTLM